MATRAKTEDQMRSALVPISAEVVNMREEVKEIKRIVTGDGNGNKGFGEQIRDNRAELERQKREMSELRNYIDSLKPIVAYVERQRSEAGKWENRLWGILQGVILLVTGYLLGTL